MPSIARVPPPLHARTRRGAPAPQRHPEAAEGSAIPTRDRGGTLSTADVGIARFGAALQQHYAGRGPPRPHGRNLPLFFPTLRDSGGGKKIAVRELTKPQHPRQSARRSVPRGLSPHSGSAPGSRMAEGRRGTPSGTGELRVRPRGTHSPAGRRDGAGAAAAVYAARAGAALFLLSGPEPPDVSAAFAYSTQSPAPVRDGGTAPTGHAGMGTVVREGPDGGHRERTAGPHRRRAESCGAVLGRHTWSVGGGVPTAPWGWCRSELGGHRRVCWGRGIRGTVGASWIGKVSGCWV